MKIDKPALFEHLGYEPHPGQAPVHASNARRRVVACGVRWGKTRCAAMEGIAAALAPCDDPLSVGWVVAPTFELANKVFREIVHAAMTSFRHRVIRFSEGNHLLTLVNLGGGTSEVRAKTADSPVSLLGEGLHWLVVDEAARLKPVIWERYLSQRLVDKNGWALMISTPWGKGWFYEAYKAGRDREQSDWKSWNAPSWGNPYLKRDLIEADRGRLPERVFRQEYAGEFVEGAGAVFRGVRDHATGEGKTPVEGRRYWAGIDLAKVEDYTVVIVLDEAGEVVAWDRFNRIDWNQQVERVKAMLDRYNNALALVDSTGVGDPVYESMRLAGIRVSGFKFTARSKTDLVNNLAQQVERGDLTLPTYDRFPECVEELESFQYSVTDQGNVRSSAPSGGHDDIVMALGLAAWARTKRMRPVRIRSFESAADLAARRDVGLNF